MNIAAAIFLLLLRHILSWKDAGVAAGDGGGPPFVVARIFAVGREPAGVAGPKRKAGAVAPLSSPSPEPPGISEFTSVTGSSPPPPILDHVRRIQREWSRSRMWLRRPHGPLFAHARVSASSANAGMRTTMPA